MHQGGRHVKGLCTVHDSTLNERGTVFREPGCHLEEGSTTTGLPLTDLTHPFLFLRIRAGPRWHPWTGHRSLWFRWGLDRGDTTWGQPAHYCCPWDWPRTGTRSFAVPNCTDGTHLQRVSGTLPPAPRWHQRHPGPLWYGPRGMETGSAPHLTGVGAAGLLHTTRLSMKVASDLKPCPHMRWQAARNYLVGDREKNSVRFFMNTLSLCQFFPHEGMLNCRTPLPRCTAWSGTVQEWLHPPICCLCKTGLGYRQRAL